MTLLSFFIIFLVAFTIITSLYTLNRLKQPFQSKQREPLTQTNFIDYWKNAETTNGRLAMMGLLILVINYGLFGWIIPGFF
tara:strand:- start:7 stop:249 length:243 start_codon:yes stop_codon:yes gene_type:complete